MQQLVNKIFNLVHMQNNILYYFNFNFIKVANEKSQGRKRKRRERGIFMIKQFNPNMMLNKQHKSVGFGKLDNSQVEIFNVQGGFPVKDGKPDNPIAYQGELGGSCWGGQLTYTNSAAGALKEFTDTDKIFVAGQQFNIPGRVAGATQPFANSYELANNKVAYVRGPLTSENKYIDKEDVSKDGGKNEFYKNLTQKYIGQIQDTIQKNTGEKNTYAGNVIGGYIDGYIAIRHNDEVLKGKGEEIMPHNVWILHSAGGPKFKNMLLKRAENESNLVHFIAQSQSGNVKDIVKQVVNHYSDELLNDHKYEFASRMRAEKIAFTDPTTKVVVNSPFEITEQINAYPYTTKTEGVNDIDPNNINVITPGVDKKRFLRSSDTEGHIKNAMDSFSTRYQADIPKDRQGLHKVLTVGRLDEKKNYHGIIKAFAKSKGLRDRANLVLVINGEDRGVNYLQEAQRLDKQVQSGSLGKESAKKQLEAKKIANSDYLMELANIVNRHDQLKGAITSISLPDANEFGGLHIGLGEEGKTIGGLNSTQEPYGLVPAEQNLARIPGPVANTAGVYAELTGIAPGFDPNDPSDIANAYIEMINNKDKYAKPLKDWAEGKTWESWCKNVLDLAQKGTDITYNEFNALPAAYSKPINYTSKEFVDKGKKMINDANKVELEKGKDGVFKNVFVNVEKLLSKKSTVDAKAYSNIAHSHHGADAPIIAH